MLTRVLKIAGYIAAILVVIATVWAVYTIILLFIAAASAAKIGVITAAISVAALIYNNDRQQARELKSRHFIEKRQAYQKFFDFMFEVFAAQRNGVDMEETELADRMQFFVKEIMIWGSPETINQYNIFIRDSIEILPDGDTRIFSRTETLMRSLRKDLGHDDRKLENLGLTKLLIKGDEHDKLN